MLLPEKRGTLGETLQMNHVRASQYSEPPCSDNTARPLRIYDQPDKRKHDVTGFTDTNGHWRTA